MLRRIQLKDPPPVFLQLRAESVLLNGRAMALEDLAVALRDGQDGEPERVLCSEAEGIFIRPKVSILEDALAKSKAQLDSRD